MKTETKSVIVRSRHCLLPDQITRVFVLSVYDSSYYNFNIESPCIEMIRTTIKNTAISAAIPPLVIGFLQRRLRVFNIPGTVFQYSPALLQNCR